MFTIILSFISLLILKQSKSGRNNQYMHGKIASFSLFLFVCLFFVISHKNKKIKNIQARVGTQNRVGRVLNANQTIFVTPNLMKKQHSSLQCQMRCNFVKSHQGSRKQHRKVNFIVTCENHILLVLFKFYGTLCST